MSDLQKPSLGRTVLYTTLKGNVRPAVIVRVWGSEATSACNLNVHTDFSNDAGNAETFDAELAKGASTGVAWVTSKSQHETGEARPGFWHFPPRV